MEKPFSFSASREKAEKQFGLGKGEYLKLQEGANRIRLMSECIPYESTFQGRKNFKWVCWVIDRVDGVVKPFFMPHTIYKSIEALQVDPDYAFASVPMPYDIKINAKGAGTKEVDYQVIASPKLTPLTEKEVEDLSARLDIHEFVEKLKEKTGEQVPAPTDEQRQREHAEIEESINPSDIPF